MASSPSGPAGSNPPVGSLHEAPVRDQHPDRLDRVQRDALGAGDDRLDRGLRQARREPGEQVAHRRLVERLEVEREERALARAPAGPPLEQLRAGERDDQDRDVAAPLQQVLDEVERARVRPVQVLEQQRDGRPSPASRSKNVAPGREQLGGAAGGRLVRRRAARGARPRSGGAPSRRGRAPRRGRRCGPGSSPTSSVSSRPRARADHLAQRPEGDRPRRTTASGPRATTRLDDAVDVLEELPGEAALADARLARDRDEPDPALARRRVEQVLEQAQLRVAADERRLEALVATAAAALRDDPQGAPRGDRRGLALEQLLAGRLVRDRVRRRALGLLADEHGARRGDRLEPGGGVRQVAGDDALVAWRRA